MDKRVCLIFILNFICVYAAINITQLRGPDSVEYGSTEEIILDCDFEAAANEKDLELKWFYNGDRQVIYQWVPDANKSGFAMGLLKDHIDAHYIATNDSNSMYRALRIFNVTTDLSGNYTCKVSSFDNEDSMTKRLIVYIPSQSGLDGSLMENDQKVVCSATGVFPKPEINIYLVEGDHKADVSNFTDNNTVDCDLDENGLYNYTATYFFPNLTNFKSNTQFVCELNIPGTDYLLVKSIIYQGVEVIEYDLDEEDILNFDNITSTEEYPYSTNSTYVMEDNSATISSPGVRLSAALALLLLILCK